MRNNRKETCEGKVWKEESGLKIAKALKSRGGSLLIRSCSMGQGRVREGARGRGKDKGG